ncbi:hypothetical protein EVAR_35354_1 [Eumeta japonica]|uniref:Uncharacterized protein n=1 Tax=Eumeta variegata TaxID=151549 RepID=A0A4C1XLT4_EUMVA|nr:hypothetical protein EVAR_35354_1 [Eumeta japonica]
MHSNGRILALNRPSVGYRTTHAFSPAQAITCNDDDLRFFQQFFSLRSLRSGVRGFGPSKITPSLKTTVARTVRSEDLDRAEVESSTISRRYTYTDVAAHRVDFLNSSSSASKNHRCGLSCTPMTSRERDSNVIYRSMVQHAAVRESGVLRRSRVDSPDKHIINMDGIIAWYAEFEHGRTSTKDVSRRGHKKNGKKIGKIIVTDRRVTIHFIGEETKISASRPRTLADAQTQTRMNIFRVSLELLQQNFDSFLARFTTANEIIPIRFRNKVTVYDLDKTIISNP